MKDFRFFFYFIKNFIISIEFDADCREASIVILSIASMILFNAAILLTLFRNKRFMLDEMT